MSYLQLTYLHLGTVFPAFLIGTYLLMERKGTSRHKFLGKIYMFLMMLTALLTLFMSAKVGPLFLGHFGFLHLLSIFVLFNVPAAYFAARSGNIKMHRRIMMGLYMGGILVAGGFTFMPGRFLHEWLFS